MMYSFLTYIIADSIIEGLDSHISHSFLVADFGIRKGRKFVRLKCIVRFDGNRCERMIFRDGTIVATTERIFSIGYGILY
jgi:hypothetical protein